MLEQEEAIVAKLQERFEGLTITIQRERRIWLVSPREGFLDVLRYIHDDLGFILLCTATGLDCGDEFQIIYHVADPEGIVLNARVVAPAENPVFDTASDIYQGVILAELEARNLLGLNIIGLPEDIAYPLPDNWPKGEYPLRKSWVVPGTEPEAAGKAAKAEEGGE